MDLVTIFEPARVELESLGFQSPKTAPMLQARPLGHGCWAYFFLRGTENFVLPMTSFTLPDLAASMFKIWPKLRMGPAPKDFDGRFMPPLLLEEDNLLGDADPVWGPQASLRRGTSLGIEEFRALADAMDRYARKLETDQWTEDKVMEQVLAAPVGHPSRVWARWIAPVWFAKRGAWDELNAFGEGLVADPPNALNAWGRYADKVRAHFGQTGQP